MIPGKALVEASRDYVDACEALDKAQEYYDLNWRFLDNGPRATVLAALATAHFAKVSAGAILLLAAHEATS